ncbi:MAG: T9SS type A sorting domain-containing protein [Bacteroidota bacterium]|nr:T9SS type A sorting domain-containing protein [Bacteroidota bacterium]
MKKLTLVCSIYLSLSFTINAQQITNGGFENWDTKTGFNTPTGWSSLDDEFFSQTGIATVTKETDAKSGSFAAKVKVAGTSATGLAGLLAIGNDENFAGISFKGRPASFSGWTKYKTMGGDTAAIYAMFSKYNAATDELDLIGFGFTSLAGTQTSYGQFNIPIIWFTGDAPDSLQLMVIVGNLSSGDPIGTVGSYILLDDLTFGPSSGTNELTLNEHINIFPNPAKEMVEIGLSNELLGAEIQIKDINGKLVYFGKQTTINLNDFNKGIYFVQISHDGYQVTKKLFIE